MFRMLVFSQIFYISSIYFYTCVSFTLPYFSSIFVFLNSFYLHLVESVFYKCILYDGSDSPILDNSNFFQEFGNQVQNDFKNAKNTYSKTPIQLKMVQDNKIQQSLLHCVLCILREQLSRMLHLASSATQIWYYIKTKIL